MCNESLPKQDEITFGTIRKYCSVIDKVSICFYETSAYENYESIRDVPIEYNELYLYGFGLIKSEFGATNDFSYNECIEIVLSKELRNDWR